MSSKAEEHQRAGGVFREVSLVVTEGVDVSELARRLVAPGGVAHVVVWAPAEASTTGDPWSAWSARLEALDAYAMRVKNDLEAIDITGTFSTALTTQETSIGVLFETCDAAPPDVVILVGEAVDGLARRWCQEALDLGWAAGWAPAAWREDAPRLVMPFASGAHALPLGAFLMSRVATDAPLTFMQVSTGEATRADPEVARELTGWAGELRFESVSGGLIELPGLLEDGLTGSLTVLPSSSTLGIGRAGEVELMVQLSAKLRAPALLVPSTRGALPSSMTLDACDVVWPGSKGRFYVWSVDAWRRATPADGVTIALVRGGEVAWSGVVERGRAEGGATEPGVTLGVAAAGDADPVARVESIGRMLDPGATRVGLFDASVGSGWLPDARVQGAERRWWAVRLDDVAPSTLRARTQGADALIDAGAVLDDGHPDDLPAEARAIRLGRVARRLRAEGVQVDVVVGPVACAERGHAWLRPAEVDALGARIARAWRPPEVGGWSARLSELTGARETRARRISVELDNRAFRERMLGMIMIARERVELQTYIFSEDAAGAQVARALGAAARRGVRVRLLVDSLWSQDGSFGMSNATLRALDMGEVEVRRRWPVALEDGIEGFKRRDHRKLLIVDGAEAIVSGRNIGDAYLTGFDEVALSQTSSHIEVPWLDASIVASGEVVEDVLEAFERAWTDSGGARAAAIEVPREEDDATAWLVTHEGLRDAHTLDAQRELIDRAQRVLWLVNTFPIQKELRSALRDALERGVDVRVMMGNVRPIWGGARTPFQGGASRALATEVIHGRMSDLIRRGARAWEFGVDAAEVESWSTDLGHVLPHVHAKVVCVDDEVIAIGSANLDISAAYWESEAILIVEDARAASALAARLEGFLEASALIDPSDARWAARWAAREVLSEHWPSVLG